MITIVVPSRTDEYLDKLLTSIELSQPWWLQQRAEEFRLPGIIVVDNGLSQEFRDRWEKVVQFVPLEPPFVFAKAMNLGVSHTHPESDLLLMNDDARILSPRFLDTLALWSKTHAAREYGVVSPAIDGGVGNPEQTLAKAPPDGEVREVDTTICFVTVFIPRKVWDTVGPLDESFVGYSHDDDDWNHRARLAGFKCGVLGGIVIEHGFGIFSMNGTYARVYDTAALTESSRENQRLFVQKWGATPEGLRRLKARELGPVLMDLWEFVQLGYLQEINRQFLHPLGLSLAVKADLQRQQATFLGITDQRGDPEGIVFADGVADVGKASRITEEQRVRREARMKGLGYWIQPVEGVDAPPSE